MKKFISFIICAAIIFGINLYFENERTKIKKVLDPENAEIIHFTFYDESGEEPVYSVMNSYENKTELLEILSGAERKNYKEKFEYESGERNYTVHFTSEEGQQWLTIGSKCYAHRFYGKGYEIINGAEILKEIEAFMAEIGG